jgi:hypothetical protein
MHDGVATACVVDAPFAWHSHIRMRLMFGDRATNDLRGVAMARLHGFATYPDPERGFRGWLVFFFVTACLGVLVRGYTFALTGQLLWRSLHGAADIAPQWSAILRFVIEAALFIGTVQGLRMFARGDRRTPTYWAAFFLVSIPAILAFDALVAIDLARLDRRDFAGEFLRLVRGALSGILISLVWALYWMRSRRVRLTYGANAFARSLPASDDTANGVG